MEQDGVILKKNNINSLYYIIHNIILFPVSIVIKCDNIQLFCYNNNFD